jgi:hypothetical protein
LDVLPLYRSHYEKEHLIPKSFLCTYCGKKYDKNIDLSKHLDLFDGDCVKQPIDCVYKSIGCNIDLDSSVKINNINNNEPMEMAITDVVPSDNQKMRYSLNYHMNSSIKYHLDLVFNNLNRRINQLELKNNNETLKTNDKLQSFNSKDLFSTGYSSFRNQNNDTLLNSTTLSIVGTNDCPMVGVGYDQGPSTSTLNRKVTIFEFNSKRFDKMIKYYLFQ